MIASSIGVLQKKEDIITLIKYMGQLGMTDTIQLTLANIDCGIKFKVSDIMFMQIIRIK